MKKIIRVPKPKIGKICLVCGQPIKQLKPRKIETQDRTYYTWSDGHEHKTIFNIKL
jgi:hypothetical protein